MDSINNIQSKIQSYNDNLNLLNAEISETRGKIEKLENDPNEASAGSIALQYDIMKDQCRTRILLLEQIAKLETRMDSFAKDSTDVACDSISFSTVSEKQFKKYISRYMFDLTFKDSSEYPPVKSKQFRSFKWTRDEEASKKKARNHLINELTKFGVIFGRKHFFVYDVHTLKEILTIEDSKIGHLKGGTDLIIGPYGKPNLSIAMQACVAIELKTEHAIKRYGIQYYLQQAALELIACNYVSHQLSVVVLTDLSTSAMVLVLEEATGTKINISVYEKLSLDQMAVFIKDHLENMCSIQSDYSFLDNDTTSAKILKTFKKKTGSPMVQSLCLEHFIDMEPYLTPFSVERAQMAANIFKEADIPTPEILNMFL